MGEFASAYAKEGVALVAVVLAFVLSQLFRPRARIIYSVKHAFTFLVEQPLLDAEGNEVAPKQRIETASFVVRNEGVEPATKVEITFNWKPLILNLWPPRHYAVTTAPDGRFTVTLASLAPKEDVSFEIIGINANLPGLTVLRSDQCVGVEKQMAMMPVHPRWRLTVFAALLALGFAAAVYLLVGGIQLLAQL